MKSSINSKQIEALKLVAQAKHIDGRTFNGLVRAGLARLNDQRQQTLTDAGLSAIPAVTAVKPVRTVKLAKVMPVCACGCGAHTKGGTFCMGHDAKLVGIIMSRSAATHKQAKALVHDVKTGKAKDAASAIHYAIGTHGAPMVKVAPAPKA